ncbi:hypothetical protein Bca101_020212 [Brassica carinata]
MIPQSVGIRSPSKFERAPDGGVNEVAIYEAYLEAGMRSSVPSIVAEVSSYFGFCPSQITPPSWRTLMAIQVLGELRGFHIGVNEPGFYFLRPLDGAPLVREPSRGARGNYPFGDDWDNRYVFMKVQEPIRYLRSGATRVSSRVLCWGGSGEASDEHSSTVPMGELPGNVMELPISAIFRTYQGVKTRRKRSSRALLARLARAAALESGPPPFPSVDVGAGINRSFPGDGHQKLFAEVLSLRDQGQDMMVHRDPLFRQARVAARWELMKEWLEERTGCCNPGKEYRRYLSLFRRPSVESGHPTTPMSAGSRVSAGLPF